MDSPGPYSPGGLCIDFPMRKGFLAQVVVPANMSPVEAKRLCAMINTLPLNYCRCDPEHQQCNTYPRCQCGEIEQEAQESPASATAEQP
jgi:hypothetical protein